VCPWACHQLLGTRTTRSTGTIRPSSAASFMSTHREWLPLVSQVVFPNNGFLVRAVASKVELSLT
jgi:hypothetical protein